MLMIILLAMHRYISLFFVNILLLALFILTNSPLNAVFIFTLSCLSTASHTRSSITLSASSKNLRLTKKLLLWFDVIRIDHRSESAASISRQTRDLSLCSCTHQHARTIAPITTLHPRVARSSPPRIYVQRRTLGTTQFLELFDALIASL